MRDELGPDPGRPPEAPSCAPRPPPSVRVSGGRAARRRAARRSRRAAVRLRRRRRALGVAVLAALAVAAVLVAALVRDGGDRGPDTAGVGSAPVAAGIPDPPPELTAWLRSELPEGGTVTAAAELRPPLLRAGVDPRVLPETAPEGRPAAHTPQLVLGETRPEGGRLLARFDRGAGAPPLLLVDPAPVDPTDAQFQRRQSLAAAVLANPTTRVDGSAREVLAAADVDPRLLALVAALAAQDGVGLRAFPALPGEQPGSAPARRVVVDAVGGVPVPTDGTATQRLVAWLEAQLAPFAPDTVEVTGDGVLVGFAYVPGPDAVVAAATP